MYFVSYEFLRNVYGVISKDFIQVKQDFHSRFTTRLIHSQKRTKKLNQDLLNAIHKFDIEFDTEMLRCLSSSN